LLDSPYDLVVPLLVALEIDAGGETRKLHVHLPDRPRIGERIELPDGSRVVVRAVEFTTERDNVDAVVKAIPTSWEPSRQSPLRETTRV
jgi:hypothetical protein